MKPFETEADQQTAVNNFRNLLTSPGWGTYLQVINYNIELITEMILTGKGIEGEKLTDDEIRVLRADLGHWRNFRDLPSDTIEDFTVREEVQISDDPYNTADELIDVQL